MKLVVLRPETGAKFAVIPPGPLINALDCSELGLKILMYDEVVVQLWKVYPETGDAANEITPPSLTKTSSDGFVLPPYVGLATKYTLYCVS